MNKLILVGLLIVVLCMITAEAQRRGPSRRFRGLRRFSPRSRGRRFGGGFGGRSSFLDYLRRLRGQRRAGIDARNRNRNRIGLDDLQRRRAALAARDSSGARRSEDQALSARQADRVRARDDFEAINEVSESSSFKLALEQSSNKDVRQVVRSSKGFEQDSRSALDARNSEEEEKFKNEEVKAASDDLSKTSLDALQESENELRAAEESDRALEEAAALEG